MEIKNFQWHVIEYAENEFFNSIILEDDELLGDIAPQGEPKEEEPFYSMMDLAEDVGLYPQL